eukprot:gene2204-33764_t
MCLQLPKETLMCSPGPAMQVLETRMHQVEVARKEGPPDDGPGYQREHRRPAQALAQTSVRPSRLGVAVHFKGKKHEGYGNIPDDMVFKYPGVPCGGTSSLSMDDGFVDDETRHVLEEAKKADADLQASMPNSHTNQDDDVVFKYPGVPCGGTTSLSVDDTFIDGQTRHVLEEAKKAAAALQAKEAEKKAALAQSRIEAFDILRHEGVKGPEHPSVKKSAYQVPREKPDSHEVTVKDSEGTSSASAEQDRLRLKSLSEERAQRWPNTLSAQRSRKERARNEKAAAEESERVEVDRGEAEMRAESRRMQIERANKILFDETDRVKGFHSAMLVSDVVHENNALVGYKRQVDVLKKAQEAAFVEQQKQAQEMAEAAELRRFEVQRQKALQTRDMLLDQVEGVKTRIQSERRENKREGELIRQRAIEEEEESRAKELARMARSKQLMEDTKNANQALQGIRQKEKEKAREAELAVEAYARKKADMIAEREQREAEKRALKEADRKLVADRIENDFKSRMHLEEARLARDLGIAEQKSADDEMARQQYMLDSQASRDRCNREQLQKKKEAKARDVAEEMEVVKEWEGRLKALKVEEEQERRETFERNKGVASFQLRQAQIRARKKAEAKIQELQDAAQVQMSVREQEEIFQQYAAECIREYEAQNKPTKPMYIHLNKKESIDKMR